MSETRKRRITETALAGQVESLLDRYHWKWMHIKPSIMQSGNWASSMNKGGKGWLDYLCLRPPRIVVFELKDDYSKMTSEQKEWFELWQSVEAEVYLFRPQDINEIIEVLTNVEEVQ